jgi:hypothetical protein
MHLGFGSLPTMLHIELISSLLQGFNIGGDPKQFFPPMPAAKSASESEGTNGEENAWRLCDTRVRTERFFRGKPGH